MKAILYFVKRGRPTEADKAAVEAIRSATQILTVFRNADVAGTESVEDCLGVAGLAPEAYSAKFKDYSQTKVKAIQQPTETNALGLPLSHPDNRDDLVAALNEREVVYPSTAKNKTLVRLYRENFLKA